MPHIPLGLLGHLSPEEILAVLMGEEEPPLTCPMSIQNGLCQLLNTLSVIPAAGHGGDCQNTPMRQQHTNP